MWKGLTPVVMDSGALGSRRIDRTHPFFAKYVLPADQASLFTAPPLGPETQHWLMNDTSFVAAEKQISLDIDIANAVEIRICRWFQILQDKVASISAADPAGSSTTVSIDAVNLLDDLTEAQELLAQLIRDMNSRRLRLVQGRLPKIPKCQKPPAAFVTEPGGFLGGATMESAAQAAVSSRG